MGEKTAMRGLIAGLVLALAAVGGVRADGAVDDPVTRSELTQVRQATEQYHDVSQAMADGYLSDGHYEPGMGFHYGRFDLVDATFELSRPEVLVYAGNGADDRRLVAVEYIAVGAAAPEGFTGDHDVWMFHEASCHYTDGTEERCASEVDATKTLAFWHPDLWALHAWIWQGNPDGVFAHFNPSVP